MHIGECECVSLGPEKNTGHEAAMPADGAVVAADCCERRYRHIPLSRQLTNEPVEPSDIASYQELNAPKRSRRLIGVRSQNDWQDVARSGHAIGYAPDNEIYALVIFRSLMI